MISPSQIKVQFVFLFSSFTHNSSTNRHRSLKFRFFMKWDLAFMKSAFMKWLIQFHVILDLRIIYKIRMDSVFFIKKLVSKKKNKWTNLRNKTELIGVKGASELDKGIYKPPTR